MRSLTYVLTIFLLLPTARVVASQGGDGGNQNKRQQSTKGKQSAKKESGPNAAVKKRSSHRTARAASQAPPIHILTAFMAKDDNGKAGEVTTAYSPGDRRFHCVINLSNGKDETKVKFVWKKVDVEGSRDVEIYSTDYITKPHENRVQAHLDPPRNWPAGRYKVEVYIKGVREKTIGYTVTGNETVDRTPNSNSPIGRAEFPSSRYQDYSTLGGTVRVSVPNNWQQLSESNSVWFSPKGAYGQHKGQFVYTHGVSFGMAQTQSPDLQQATQEFLNALAQRNTNLRQISGLMRTTLAGRTGLTSTLSNVNEATAQSEAITVITTRLRNGQLFYMIAVAPDNESANYQIVFRNVFRSLQFND
jgi:hypothetical protein